MVSSNDNIMMYIYLCIPDVVPEHTGLASFVSLLIARFIIVDVAIAVIF